MSEIPKIKMGDEGWEKELRFCLSTLDSSSDYRNDRERPYNGQPHTDEGERGKQLVAGLTMRDIRDCFVKGLLRCCGTDQPGLYEKVGKNTWRTMDVFKIDLSKLDPLAVSQAMNCEIEKMMGIFPNCKPIDIDELLGGKIDE